MDLREFSGPCEGQSFKLHITFAFNGENSDRVGWVLKDPQNIHTGDFLFMGYDKDTPPSLGFTIYLKRYKHDRKFSGIPLIIDASLKRRFEEDLPFQGRGTVVIRCEEK